MGHSFSFFPLSFSQAAPGRNAYTKLILYCSTYLLLDWVLFHFTSAFAHTVSRCVYKKYSCNDDDGSCLVNFVISFRFWGSEVYFPLSSLLNYLFLPFILFYIHSRISHTHISSSYVVIFWFSTVAETNENKLMVCKREHATYIRPKIAE